MGKIINLNTYYYNKTEIDALLEDKASVQSVQNLSNALDQNTQTIWNTLGPLPDGKEDKSNKIGSWNSTPDGNKYPNEPLVKSELNNLSSGLTDIWKTLGPLPNTKEDKSNKIDSWSSAPSNTKYPSEYLIKPELDNKANKTDLNGASIQFNYPIERFDIGSRDTVRSAIEKITGKVYKQSRIDEMLNEKVDKTNGASQITDTNAPNYINIGSLTNKATQQAINQAINTKLGTINTDVSTLKSIKAIQVVASKPTASADTMNKLYIVSEDDKVNVYYTVQNGSTYLWSKMDTDILDELSIDWNDINGKPNIPTKTSDLTNDSGFLTEETIPESFNCGYIDGDLVLHLVCAKETVTIQKAIMQKEETNNITVVVTDEDDNILVNAPVEIYINDIQVGDTMYTDSNGTVSYVYTGVGAGKLEVQAKIGSFQSETYSIWDCLVYDDGISDPKKTPFIKSANGTVTISSNGTTFQSSSNATYRNTTLITGDFEIVLQASLTGSVRIGVQTGADLGYKQSKFNYYDVSDYYFKLKRVGSTITAQYSVDGVNWNNRSLETDNVADNDCYFLIFIETTGTERTITYKDLKIYPI